MRLPIDDVETRSREIALEFNRSLDPIQVVANDGESDHVELLLTISGCHADPCTVIVNVPRDDRTFDSDLRLRIREALGAHTLPSGQP